jgi:DNA-binding XRE family transcriptional regulator
MEQKNCDFSALVKQVRRQLSLSQEDLAHHLGVSYTTVNRWENGQSRPSKLAKVQFNAFCRNMTKRGRLALPENRIDPANARQD